MNERLKELYEQAHEQKPIIVADPETCEPTHKLGHGGVPMYHNVFNPEKFAELIVRECVSTLHDMHLWQSVNNQNYPSAWHDAVDKGIDAIKEHFGVK